MANETIEVSFAGTSQFLPASAPDFLGREWVFAELNQWLADPGNPRRFLLTGAPGSGKSAIARRLWDFSSGRAVPAPGAGLLHVTSADLLEADWRRRGRAGRAGDLLAPLGERAVLVTVIDGHPATLSRRGAVLGHRVKALGTDRFGQSADLIDLYRVHGLDADAILDACAAALLAA